MMKHNIVHYVVKMLLVNHISHSLLQQCWTITSTTPELLYIYQNWPGNVFVEEMLYNLINGIYNEYISESSTREVNIDSNTRRKLDKSMKL